jgi:hypothetical protein
MSGYKVPPRPRTPHRAGNTAEVAFFSGTPGIVRSRDVTFATNAPVTTSMPSLTHFTLFLFRDLTYSSNKRLSISCTFDCRRTAGTFSVYDNRCSREAHSNGGETHSHGHPCAVNLSTTDGSQAIGRCEMKMATGTSVLPHPTIRGRTPPPYT